MRPARCNPEPCKECPFLADENMVHIRILDESGWRNVLEDHEFEHKCHMTGGSNWQRCAGHQAFKGNIETKKLVYKTIDDFINARLYKK